MSQYEHWPEGLVEILKDLKEFSETSEEDVCRQEGRATHFRAALSFGYRCEVLVDETTLENLRAFYGRTDGKRVRFTLPGEATPREGKLKEPQVAAGPGDRHWVEVTIGGGQPVA